VGTLNNVLVVLLIVDVSGAHCDWLVALLLLLLLLGPLILCRV
jgi:hypothetical protein